MSTLLSVENLETTFFTKAGPLKAVDGVSFSIARGETLGFVGESGCGKSVTTYSLLRLLPKNGRVTGGRALFDGVDLVTMGHEPIRRIRGKRIAMIFQEPMTALNPVLTVGTQIAEQILAHEHVSHQVAMDRAVALLHAVGIPSPEQRAASYPHQMSGGMRQRAMIAMAISCKPDLLIADEPTTALDVTVQAQILDLLRNLQKETGMAMLFITHDLGVISEIADRVVVMYAGRIVEEGASDTLFRSPNHPYTRGLLRSIPSLDRDDETLYTIDGFVPPLDAMPSGCRFRNRCPNAREKCAAQVPLLESLGAGHRSACYYPAGQAERGLAL